MIDVHAPHETVHTWKDFFIHVATICVGLLIAIGLEQSVEAIHHHFQVKEARERIREELEVNIAIDKRDVQYADDFIAEMTANMDALRAREAGKPPAIDHLDFTVETQSYYNAAFASAQESGVLAMMPYDEAAMYSDAYGYVAANRELLVLISTSLSLAKAAPRDHTLAQLTPEEVQAVLTACSNVKQDMTKYRALHVVSQQEWDAALSGHYRTDFHAKTN